MQAQWCRPFLHHMAMSLWRKKPLLLAIVMVSTVLVLAFQYHSVAAPKSVTGDSLVRTQEVNGPHFAASAVNSNQPSQVRAVISWSMLVNASPFHLQTIPRRNLSAINSRLVEGRIPYRPPYNSDPALVGNPGRQRAIITQMDNHVRHDEQPLKQLDPVAQQGMALPKGGYVPGMRMVHFDMKVGHQADYRCDAN